MRRWALAVRWTAWILFFALPILYLVGEVALALEQRTSARRAREFRRQHPSAFAAYAARFATSKSLWASPSRYRPGARLETTNRGTRYVVEINSLGYRTREFSPRKPPGTIRVICIGGSTTVAGDTNETTYPSLLEERLRALRPERTIEVLNLGVSGVLSDFWLKQEERLLEFEPDVVIQYEGVNDILWGALPSFAREHPWRRALSRSLLFERLSPVRASELEPDLRRVVLNQERLARLCRRHGIAHLAGSFAGPDYEAATPEMRGFLDIGVREWTIAARAVELSRYSDYAVLLRRYDELLGEAAAGGRLVGVPVDRTLTDPLLFIDLCHLTQEGIGRLADAFVPAASAAVGERLAAPSRGAP